MKVGREVAGSGRGSGANAWGRADKQSPRPAAGLLGGFFQGPCPDRLNTELGWDVVAARASEAAGSGSHKSGLRTSRHRPGARGKPACMFLHLHSQPDLDSRRRKA